MLSCRSLFIPKISSQIKPAKFETELYFMDFLMENQRQHAIYPNCSVPASLFSHVTCFVLLFVQWLDFLFLFWYFSRLGIFSIIIPNLDPPSPSSGQKWTFYILSILCQVTHRWISTHPPLLVHVIIEWPPDWLRYRVWIRAEILIHIKDLYQVQKHGIFWNCVCFSLLIQGPVQVLLKQRTK